MSIKSMPTWKWALLLVVSLFLGLIMYGLGGMAQEVYHGPLAWCMSILIGAIMLGLYAFFVHAFEGAWPEDLPLSKCAGQTALGLATGLGNFLLVVGAMALFGFYKVESTGCDWKVLADAFSMFLIVAIGEEVVFRGIFFRWLDEKWGLTTALAVSGLVFGLVHVGNPNATLWAGIAIALESGLLLGMAYKWAGNLWFPIGIHWSWNFVQGNVFGFAVSGTDAGASWLHPLVSGPDWLTGGAFGAEASVLSSVVGLAITAWFLCKHLKNK